MRQRSWYKTYRFQFLLLGSNNLFLASHAEQWSHLGEETPPGPIAKLQIGHTVALDDLDGLDILDALLNGPTRKQKTWLPSGRENLITKD